MVVMVVLFVFSFSMFQMLPILAWFGGRMPSSFGWKALGAERPTIPPLGSCSEIFLGWCPDNQREGHFGGETLGITNQLVILVFFGGIDLNNELFYRQHIQN